MAYEKIIMIEIGALFKLVKEYKEFIKELPRHTTEDWIYIHNMKLEMKAYNMILNGLGLQKSIDRLREKRSRTNVGNVIAEQERIEEVKDE